MTALLGALIDPFLLIPAALIGLVPRLAARATITALIGVLITVLIVQNLEAANLILPSDKTAWLVEGSLTRWLVAWAVAEIVAWLRRKKWALRKQSEILTRRSMPV